jgi:UPF0716 family protein affecting phage T7 exclusion
VNALLALLRRPVIEIAAIVGMALLLLAAAAVFIVILFRSIGALLERLHIKKIGVGGIECAPDAKRKRR